MCINQNIDNNLCRLISTKVLVYGLLHASKIVNKQKPIIQGLGFLQYRYLVLLLHNPNNYQILGNCIS